MPDPGTVNTIRELLEGEIVDIAVEELRAFEGELDLVGEELNAVGEPHITGGDANMACVGH